MQEPFVGGFGKRAISETIKESEQETPDPDRLPPI